MFYIYLAAGLFGAVLLTVLIVAFRRLYLRILKLNSRTRRAQMLDELAKLRVFEWSDALPTNDTCAICREIFLHRDPLRILVCDHGYHVGCIDDWIKEGSLFCPLCKQGIIPNARRYRRQDFLEESFHEETPLLN